MDTPEGLLSRLMLRVQALATQLNDHYRPSVLSLRDKIRQSQAEQDELLVRLADAEAAVRTLERDAQSRKIRNPKDAAELIPGFRHPKWYTVRLDFEADQTTAVVKELTLLPKGPFILTSVNAVYELLEDGGGGEAVQGRYVPLSGARFTGSEGGSYNAYGGGSITTRYDVFQPEFAFALEVVGATRRWSNADIASYVVDPTARNNVPGILGWIDPMDKIRITVTPSLLAPPPIKGRVVFVFCGFEIVSAIRLADLVRM